MHNHETIPALNACDFCNGRAVCKECGRVFDLLKEYDAQEWYYGHDCEV